MVTLVYNTDPVTGKRKRGRPRKIKNDNDLEDKIKVPDEVQKVIDIVKETKQKEDKEFHQVVEEVKKERKGEWDISIGDPIDFFDSRFSYELTGYKPIDRTHGLDFDPSWFTETRDTFNKTGHYCQYHLVPNYIETFGMSSIEDVEKEWNLMDIE